MSELRLPYYEIAPELLGHLRALKNDVAKSSCGRELIELLFLRVSQINGCAFCLEMHTKALRSSGVDTAKIDTVAGWRVSRHFSDAERAALAWAEALTGIAKSHAPDDIYEELVKRFDQKQIVEITFAISGMNALNMVAISMRQ